MPKKATSKQQPQAAGPDVGVDGIPETASVGDDLTQVPNRSTPDAPPAPDRGRQSAAPFCRQCGQRMKAVSSPPALTYYKCEGCGCTDKQARPPASTSDGNGQIHTCPYVQLHGGERVGLVHNRKGSTSFFKILQCPQCGYVKKLQKGGPRRRHAEAEDYSAR